MSRNIYSFKHIIFYVLLISCIVLSTNTIYSDNNSSYNCKEEICTDTEVKVGFYKYGDYYFLDKKNNPSGYYNDLLNVISKDVGFKYSYINCGIEDALNDLKNGKIDLLFGINKTPEREKYYAFTNQYISIERYSIYANKDLQYHDLKDLNGLTFAYIKNEANNEYILNDLKQKNINVKLLNVSSYEQAEEYLIDRKADFIVSTTDNTTLEEKNMKKVFEFSCGPVYIASQKENEDLIHKIDEALIHINRKKVSLTHDKYFDKYFSKNVFLNITIIILILLIFLYVSYVFIYKNIIFRKKQKKIKNNMINEKYLMFYQPIVNPKNNKIIGLESLLRMKSSNEILTPNKFIQDIEKCNMLFDISIWIVKKVLKDYKDIIKIESFKNNKFYISVNVSFVEIENNKFIEELILISKSADFIPNLICLEIVEKFKSENIEKIQKSILTLREHGFIVAIDDFGVEYSNLDLLNKIDSNIIKLDKYFIDQIKTNILTVKIIEFICEICKLEGKSIVCEGVEDSEQMQIIKNMPYEKIYIQGYFYSKPIPIELLGDLKF